MPSQTQKFNRRQSMGRNTFEIFHYRDTKPQSVSIHHHDFYEIYFFLGGNVTYFVEGQRHKLNKGDLLLINPRQLHQPLPHKGSTYERMVLWIDRQYLASISRGSADLTSCFQPSQNHVNILHSNVMMQGRIAELFELLNRETNGDGWGGQAYAESLLIQLLVEVNRMVRQKHLLQERMEELSLIHRVISYINEHYGEDLSLDFLAKKFFVSKYYLSHEFSQQIGVSVYRYVTLKRLSQAKELLSDGRSAGEVCTACGFHNYTTFYRIFKSEYGISPGKFVEQLKKQS
ncbi:MAG: helix-turn-helix domain-containing protein [Clostridia bacterium]|nr:helix-turn-helix domain-containing protein [Clostridia bacterium]